MGKLRVAAVKLISLGGTPHGIAGGFAVGVGLSLVPIPFAGMFVALALVPVLKFNPIATYLGTAVVNPVTGSFFYFFELWLGMQVMGLPAPSWAELGALDASGWWTLFTTLLRPFLVGAGVTIPCATAVSYLLVRALVRAWRGRHPADASATTERPEVGPGS